MAEKPEAADHEYPPLRGGRLFWMTVAIAISSFMEILDMTIVNVSVPSISGSLGVSNSEGTWAISSYMLAAAVMQPLTGWIGRRFGEVRTFVTSILLFMCFSAICGLATSMNMLVAARLIQGFVSGPMMSVAQAILLRNYPIERRGMAIALWAMVLIIAPIFGPIIGGWITDNLSWPWLFYINLPVGAVSAGAAAGGGVTTNAAEPPRSRTSTAPGTSSAEISSAAVESASSKVSRTAASRGWRSRSASARASSPPTAAAVVSSRRRLST